MSTPILNIPIYSLSSRCPLLVVNGELEFSTRVPLQEKERPGDVNYLTNMQDRLTLLAFKFYRDVRLWWVIYDNNASQLLNHPLDLPAGISLRIPSRQAIEAELLNDSAL